MSRGEKNHKKDIIDGLEFIWKRPEGPLRVWREFEGKKKLESGKFPKFVIQEMPEEMNEEVLDHMIDYCFTDEPTCDNVGLPNDPLGKQEMRCFLKPWMRQGISIVTLLVDPDPGVKPSLVGVNVLAITTDRDDTMVNGTSQVKSETMKRIMPVQLRLGQEADVFRRFGVDKYLASFGLSVHPSFRGHGLGQKMLRLREVIGRTYGVSLTSTLFTAIASQTLAERNGFQTIIQYRYSELLDDQGNLAYPGIPVEHIKVMAKRFDRENQRDTS